MALDKKESIQHAIQDGFAPLLTFKVEMLYGHHL